MKKLIIITAIIFSSSAVSAQSAREINRGVQKMAQFLNYLGNSYIDTMDMSLAVEDAIEGVLSGLDPHSTYVPRDEMEEVREEFSANFDGIGIEFRVFRDTVLVVNTISGGPSEKVGLLPDDRIVKVDGNSIIGIKETEVPKLLKGPKGTVVDISVRRPGVAGELDFTIIRDKIPIYTVDAAYRVDNSTGYVRINRFAATTNRELQEAISNMGGIEALIIDLRGNGGGFLDQAVAVSSNFLRPGPLVVSMEGRSIPPEKMFAHGTPLFPDGRLIVLVDEFSASASEIVSGAIQDWDRGLIVGRRTFGKGLVQTQYPLLDGSAVRVTVARYHTPSGRVIQTPYEKGATEEYYNNFTNRLLVAPAVDSVKMRTDGSYATGNASVADSTAFHTLVARRTIYGGGGITPDVTVERDTTSYSEYWDRLIRTGTILEYVTDYIGRNRNSLSSRYRDFESFEKNFTVGDEVINGLVKAGEGKEVAYDAAGMERSRGNISIQIKALVAQRLWGATEYYRVINSGADEIFSRAMEVLKGWPEYSAQLSGK